LTDTDELNHTRSFSYDASGDLTSEIGRDGRVRDFSYDHLHRRTSEQWMDGTNVIRTIVYSYGANNVSNRCGKEYSKRYRKWSRLRSDRPLRWRAKMSGRWVTQTM
jgi:YD repeat-containing protein